MSAKETQVGGSHYKGLAIQPVDYINQNNLNWFQGNIVKYATRYPHKGCAVDDLRKIIHYAQLALEAECEEVSDKDYPSPDSYGVEGGKVTRHKDMRLW